MYDRYKPDTLVKKLLDQGGAHLVVGHSSSIPLFIKRLGGNSGKRIDVASEFDRLYVIRIDAAKKASTLILRYGAQPAIPNGPKVDTAAPAIR